MSRGKADSGLRLEVWAPNMGTHRVYSRHIRIPGLRAHTRGAWFQPYKEGLPSYIAILIIGGPSL